MPYHETNSERIAACSALAKRYNFEEEHSLQVARLTLTLCDALEEVHELTQSERDLLHCAALLHDIGRDNGGAQHHKKARDIILAANALPFSKTEQTIVALLARYHRKALPGKGHVLYSSLSSPHQRVINQGASLLRIADGFDRSHESLVKGLTCSITPENVLIHVAASQYSSLDKEAAKIKADLFERTFGREVVIEWE